MIFIAAAGIVATTVVVVSVAVATRFTELVTPPASVATANAAKAAGDAPESHGCAAHLLHLYHGA